MLNQVQHDREGIKSPSPQSSPVEGEEETRDMGSNLETRQ
jgi:hypothetical protein